MMHTHVLPGGHNLVEAGADVLERQRRIAMTQSMEGTSVDFSDLMKRLEGDSELLEELTAIFVKEWSTLQDSCTHAIRGGNLQQIRKDAHTLKGMLAGLSCSYASACAGAMELSAAECDAAEIEAHWKRLQVEVVSAQACLLAFCGRRQP